MEKSSALEGGLSLGNCNQRDGRVRATLEGRADGAAARAGRLPADRISSTQTRRSLMQKTHLHSKCGVTPSTGA